MKATTEKLAAGNLNNGTNHKYAFVLLTTMFLIFGLLSNTIAQSEIAVVTQKQVSEANKSAFMPAIYSDIKPNNLENLIQVNLAGAVSEETDHIIKLYFTVDAKGKVTNITSHGVYSSKLQSSLTKLTNAMPSWEPATFNGEPIPSKVIVPVKFTSTVTRIGE